MSINWEYLDARSASVAYMDERDLYSAEDPTEQNVLVISGDEGIVVVGSAEELLAFAERVVATVKAGPHAYEGSFT